MICARVLYKVCVDVGMFASYVLCVVCTSTHKWHG